MLFLMYFLPLILGILIALSALWIIVPDKVMVYFGNVAKVVERPGEIVMGISMVTGVLLAWPWTPDGRIYFRDMREDCSKRNREDDVCDHFVNHRKDYVCCAAVCPKLKEEKENRNARVIGSDDGDSK